MARSVDTDDVLVAVILMALGWGLIVVFGWQAIIFFVFLAMLYIALHIWWG